MIMRRIERSGVTLAIPLTVLAALFFLAPLSAQKTVKTTTDIQPGDVAYSPTKLEWAALELQANYGITTYSSDSPVMIGFVAQPDGRTVLCIIQYTPDVPAEVVKINRDSSQRAFDKYVESRNWDWLRFKFQENVLRH